MAQTLTTLFQIQEEIKKSRFIVNAAPISYEQDAKAFLIAHSSPTANHNCWAWKIGSQYRFSDDGEPTGTAGRPILSAIEGNDCDHIIVVVTRFFGGIKLGAGGLVRAYGGTAAHCLQQAPLKKLILRKSYQFHCYYNQWPLLENRLPELDIITQHLEFDATGIQIEILMPEENLLILQGWISDLTKGRVLVEPLS